MKKIRIIAALVLSLCLLGLSAFAAEFTPSVEDKDVRLSDAKIYDKDGNVIHDVTETEFIVTPIKSRASADENVKKDIDDAEKELRDNELTDLVPEFAAAWTGATGGAPVANAVVSDIFDARVIGDSATKLGVGGTIGFSLDAQGLDKDDKFVVIRRGQGGTGWAVVDYTIDADGKINVKTDELGVFAIVRDSGAVAVDPNAPDSPQTGVADYAIPAAFAIAALGACAVVFGKKAFAA